MNKHLARSLSLLFALALCSCHSEADRKRAERLDDAITALRKISSAVEVGVNAQQYSSLVIEAKAKVDLANDALPVGEFRTRLNSTLENNADAGRAWAQKLDNWELLEVNDPIGGAIIQKYTLPTEEKTLTSDTGFPYKRTGIEFDDALHEIWRVAHENLIILIAAQKGK